jgi:hypothetical protein
VSLIARIIRQIGDVPEDVARWARSRFGNLEDTAANAQRVEAAVRRAAPQLARTQPREQSPWRAALSEVQRQAAQPQPSLAARPQSNLAVRRQEAPALPPPDESLPEWAAKPRGGQWVTPDSDYGPFAPSEIAKDALPVGLRFDSSARPLRDWWDKALPRYIQRDMATPDDPLRALAEQGLLHVDMPPEQWSGLARGALSSLPLQKLLFDESGRPPELFHRTRQAMPWIRSIPQTDSLNLAVPTEMPRLEFSHVADELRNAMRTDSDLPADLAVRPESLQRMSFPQAVERVGRIRQWRAAQEAEASLAAMNNPALRTYREYAEDNPRGLRWVEIAPPDGTTVAEDAGYTALRDALKYEGDVMGHCVGGYCDDVLAGRSRIFSLRDARGEPHVTIEAAPRARGPLSGEAPDAANLTDIIQIKGKQNRAPNDEYLPFVQDFVRNGTWGNVGDLGNTGLVRLPDGRYITNEQWREGIRPAIAERNPQWAPDVLDRAAATSSPTGFHADEWEQYAPYFQGYALGGRVDPDRCFTCNPLSARR